MRNQSPADLLSQHEAALARIYRSTGADCWGLSLDQFTQAVQQSIERWNLNAADTPLPKFLDSLHARGGQTLGDLAAGHAMTRQAVTKHLDILERANLVVSERRGRLRLLHLNAVPIQEIADRWIGKFRREPVRALADLKQALEKEQP